MLRTDDSVRRVRAMWLGSGALRWPWDWTYVEWGIALACGAVFVPLVGLMAALVFAALGANGVLVGIIWGPALGGYLAYQAFRELRLAVDFDRPVRWWRVMVRHELRSGRRTVRGVESTRLVATWTTPVSDTRRAELTPLVARRWRAWGARRELARGVHARLGEER
jgi:hypothetical protein